MIYKVALLIDWDNIRHKIFKNKKLLRKNTPKFSYSEHTAKLPNFFLSFLEEEKPYRIFFYLSEGYRNKVKDPNDEEIDFSQKEEVKIMDRFILRLSVQNLVAIRKGRTAFRGWKIEPYNDKKKYSPIFVQKKVDILLGLDIAHLTYNKLVDRILLFSYDTDLQPALKTARIGGLQVILPFFKEMEWKDLPLELKAHSDFIRIR
ncbi:MAG: NYN domain-containing protein, partial [Candidatus Desulfofervidus auxilii]|nr:NYN domain-containing protein [Candidatus Desulfofervidus auxilii]